MDESKLPQNPPTPHQQAPHQHVPHHPTQQELSAPPHTSVPHYASPLPGGFIPAEAWLSFIIGVIVLFMFPYFGEYVVMHNHLDDFYGKAGNTFWDKNGQSIPFEQSALFYPDMGLTAFGIVLILDSLVLLRPRFAILLWLSLVLTVLCVLLNVFAIIKAFDGAGFQLFNALAIAFGGYIALYDWRLLQLLRLT